MFFLNTVYKHVCTSMPDKILFAEKNFFHSFGNLLTECTKDSNRAVIYIVMSHTITIKCMPRLSLHSKTRAKLVNLPSKIGLGFAFVSMVLVLQNLPHTTKQKCGFNRYLPTCASTFNSLLNGNVPQAPTYHYN